jgi:uncharacterized protein (TIGR03000 family)
MRQLLLPTMILAAVLTLPATVEAQRGGRGGGGGARGGVGGARVGVVGGARVGVVGGARVGGFGGARGFGYGGFGYGGFGYGGFGYGYPGYGFGGYDGGGYYGGGANYSVYPSTTVYSPTYNILPQTGPTGSPDYGTQGPPPLPKNRAVVQVVVPDPEATLLFDGTKTTTMGRVRLFEPPDLAPGVYYSYKLTATWQQGDKVFTDVRKVYVIGGQASLVDFTRPAPPEAVPPPNKSDKDKDKD